MFTKVLAQIRKEVSGQRALNAVAEIIRHHRIQASPGYREAADWCQAELAQAGVRAGITSHPYDGVRTYWSSRSFEEWRVEDATLDLVQPGDEARRLCDFEELKLSVIQRSAPTPPEGIEAELVVVDDADREAAYTDLDLAGKLVLARGDLDRIRQYAVEDGGAVGIISDHLTEFPPNRTRLDLPDATLYTSFWWSDPAQPKCFGFALSPRQGQWLRSLVKRESAAGRRVVLRAKVTSSFPPGAIENVEGLIPGTGPGEVLIVAHLCHPQWSANDNASGCAAAIEAARALSRLIEEGKLPRPARSIRFLLVPEMAGTFAFLSSNEELIPGMVGALNLDMVGQNQELCGSSFLVERPPRSLGSYAGDLGALILAGLAEDVTNLAGTGRYGLFRHAVTPFSGGSDHWILSDPTVGVPCPMLIQWPDKYYHTSEDTLDKVDPGMLARASSFAATYAYFLATAGEPEACWLAGEMAAMFADECARGGRGIMDAGGDKEQLKERLSFLRDCKNRDLGSLRRLIDGPATTFDQAVAAAEARVQTQLAFALEHYGSLLAEREPAQAATPGGTQDQGAKVPRRKFRGPIGRREALAKLSLEQRRSFAAELVGYLEQLGKKPGAANSLLTPALYWTDGHRSLAEIDDLVRLESGWSDLGLLERWFAVLERQGFVEWVEPGGQT